MTGDGAEWAAFDDGQWSRVDHTGTPIDLIDPDRPQEEVRSVHEPGPDGASGGVDGVTTLTDCWPTGDPTADA